MVWFPLPFSKGVWSLVWEKKEVEIKRRKSRLNFIWKILTKLNKYKCCDESNNTPEIIGKNQLVVDVFIKPTMVAEFVHLKFTNAGQNSFSSIVGGA